MMSRLVMCIHTHLSGADQDTASRVKLLTHWVLRGEGLILGRLDWSDVEGWFQADRVEQCTGGGTGAWDGTGCGAAGQKCFPGGG